MLCAAAGLSKPRRAAIILFGPHIRVRKGDAMHAPERILDPSARELQQLVDARSRVLPEARPLRILLPFDGSDASMQAVRYAAACLGGRPASVHLLNAQQPVLDDPALLHAAYAIVEAHRREGERVLAAAQRVLHEARVPFESEVAMAKPVDAIVRAAVRRSIALVLMGTRGRSPLVNLLAASVPMRVVQRCSVPVLLVRAQDRLRPQPTPPFPPYIAA
jgi:nucleotide-binding universal stress UspA family protein